MLSRTADSLYWLARYVERAENTARTIDAAERLAALPVNYGGGGNEWESAVISTGSIDAFRKAYPVANRENVVEFLAFSQDNPSSISSCLEIARTNARAVRTALTMEMWETINGGWLELRKFNRASRVKASQLAEFVNFVKRIGLAFDGTAYRTMLRDDAYWFSRLGTFIERADATARLLDVKYHVLLPAGATVGGSLDYFQWTSILRAVSAQTSYHHVYRESLRPWLVADLLILRPEMPRSLTSCYDNLTHFLDNISRVYGRQGPAQRAARASYARLQTLDMNTIFQGGLHEFLDAFIQDNNRLGLAITEQYLV